jgi:hypothetical protein
MRAFIQQCVLTFGVFGAIASVSWVAWQVSEDEPDGRDAVTVSVRPLRPGGGPHNGRIASTVHRSGLPSRR